MDYLRDNPYLKDLDRHFRPIEPPSTFWSHFLQEPSLIACTLLGACIGVGTVMIISEICERYLA